MSFRPDQTGASDVTASANIADNRIVRGDGGAKGVQQSLHSILDNGTMTFDVDHTGTANFIVADYDIQQTDGNDVTQVTMKRMVYDNTGTGESTRVEGLVIDIDNSAGGSIDNMNALVLPEPSTSGASVSYLVDFQSNDYLSNVRAVRVRHGGANKFLMVSLADTGLTLDSQDITIATTTSGDINLNPVGTINLNSGQVVKRTASAAGNYTVLVTDYIIGKTGITGGGDTVTLPEAPATGQVFIVKDESGTATTNNITIDTTGAPTIDGSASVTIVVNYNSLSFYFDGTNYNIF